MRLSSVCITNKIVERLAQPGTTCVRMKSSGCRTTWATDCARREASVPEPVRAELTRRGHQLRVRPAYGISTGVVAAGIDPATGRLRGGADPRRERAIIAW
jgi:gamma-glutamyltranspeptidase